MLLTQQFWPGAAGSSAVRGIVEKLLGMLMRGEAEPLQYPFCVHNVTPGHHEITVRDFAVDPRFAALSDSET